MRLVLMSDTHGQHRGLDVPEGDVLVHAGDICMSMHVPSSRVLEKNVETLRDFDDWLGDLPHPHKVVIAGNHDFALQYVEESRGVLRSARYLQDEGVAIGGLQFWGSPWQPHFGGWAFNAHRGEEIAQKWAKIPTSTDVLITHGPPQFHHDWVGAENVGCADLLRKVHEVKPRLHVFGHIHHGYGQTQDSEALFCNAAVVNGKYQLTNDPIVVELETPDENAYSRAGPSGQDRSVP